VKRNATTARIVSGTIEPTTPPTMAATLVPPFVVVVLVSVGLGRPVELLTIVLFPEVLLPPVATVLMGFGNVSGSDPTLFATVSLYVELGNVVTL